MKKIRRWLEQLFKPRRDAQQLESFIDDIVKELNVTSEKDIIPKIKELRINLLYRASEDSIREILKVKPFSPIPLDLSLDQHNVYLQEAETIYALRPWKNIIKSFQYEQIDYMMRFTDGGDIGNLQLLVSRGALLFSDYAEKKLNELHVQYIDNKTELTPLTEDSKYEILKVG